MSASLRDLNRRVDALGTPPIDLDEVTRRGEARLRRRRGTAVAAAALAVVVAVVGGATLTRDDVRSAPPAGPSHQSNRTPTPTRQILYSEVRRLKAPPYFADGAFHFGDHVVGTDDWNTHLDVTDDGFVYTTEHARLYFNSGTRSRQIGSGVCGRTWAARPTWIGAYEQDSVLAGNAGSLVAWFECSPGARGSLVVFDTRADREVLHRQMTACATGFAASPPCGLTAVLGEHVYFHETSRFGVVGRLHLLDVRTGRDRPVTSQAYADDLRTHPRAIVVGDGPRSGTVSDGIGQGFRPVGSRLVPIYDPSDKGSDQEPATTSAFDVATGSALELHLPSAYRSDDRFTLFEWLDDDTVALAGDGDESGTGDILTCRLPDGRCSVTVEGRKGWDRVLPQTILPG